MDFEIPNHYSLLQKERLQYKPEIPDSLLFDKPTKIEFGEETSAAGDIEQIQKQFPKSFGRKVAHIVEAEKFETQRPFKVGVVFSGGPAPGGHNVIVGVFHFFKKLNPESKIIGFLDGLGGVINNKNREIVEKDIQLSFNQGGFDLLGTSREKISTDEDFEKSYETLKSHELDGLVVIGGDDAIFIAIPKTIDGDIRSKYLEMTAGFDTVCKVYSEFIGNIMRDALSAKKYYHFIRVMGRSSSHIALECSLKTHPNYVLIGEDIEKQKLRFVELIEQLTKFVIDRFNAGKSYGVIIIPEGLIQHIHTFRGLISKIDEIYEKNPKQDKWTYEEILQKLKDDEVSAKLFSEIPKPIAQTLMTDRDPFGHVRVSKIETGKLLKWSIRDKLSHEESQKNITNTSKKFVFECMTHYFGYEGRCSLPSNFDATYCYALGITAARLILHEQTGMMAVVNNLSDETKNWKALGLPLTDLLHMKENSEKPELKIFGVDVNGAPFKELQTKLENWRIVDHYRCSGPMQFGGDSKDWKPKVLLLDKNKK
ncbi:pyrophosphate--fructose 6-phosphate 1-phosphotransferase [Anaeramoeba ignava]|uniref:Pyrophosphate--fructose 6-phosphate 1-phosphotransferase n=1 Tax=Anaeramoeba ignava TaxID=1746090 RepID=A0A9Q0LHL5_ANAIG|nr:pyrophosphate--fructose 6-phosphate 1-phosphotransferase [Anaeramoeba ignava]